MIIKELLYIHCTCSNILYNSRKVFFNVYTINIWFKFEACYLSLNYRNNINLPIPNQLFFLDICFSAELKFNHLKRPYFVTMGSFQMAILLLFNNSDIQTFHDIRENTNLPEKELIKQLQTLLDTKIVSTEVRVLHKGR